MDSWLRYRISSSWSTIRYIWSKVDGPWVSSPWNQWHDTWSDRTTHQRTDRCQLTQWYCSCRPVVFWYYCWRIGSKQTQRPSYHHGLPFFSPIRSFRSFDCQSIHSPHWQGLEMELLSWNYHFINQLAPVSVLLSPSII